MKQGQFNFDEQQQEAYDYATDTTTKIVFITGKGGSGKSAVLHNVADYWEKQGSKVIKLAPTKSASDLIGGQTIHSFFKINPVMNEDAESEDELMSFSNSLEDVDVGDNTVILCDEVSMIGRRLVNNILKAVTPKKLILFGDPEQLKPVKDKPADFTKIANKTITLVNNYRATNTSLKNILSRYGKETELPSELFVLSKKSVLVDLYQQGYTFIAFKNATLSRLELLCKQGAGYKVNDEVISFGQCDRNIVRDDNTEKPDVYITNNARLQLVSKLAQFGDSLEKWRVIDPKYAYKDKSGYGGVPAVMVGSYDDYNSLLEARFADVCTIRDRLCKEHRLSAKEVKDYLKQNGDEADKREWAKAWRDYFNVKNTPYARSSQFLTTYKCQGRGIDRVVVFIDEMPQKDHIEVALGRTIEDVKIISKNIEDFDTY